MNIENFVGLRQRTTKQYFYLGIPLDQIQRANNGRYATLRQVTDPDIDTLPIAGLGVFQVAVIKGVNAIRIPGMGRTLGPVDSEPGGSD